jgi:hypothetical protein
MGLKTTYST